jgi:hypothetical protein
MRIFSSRLMFLFTAIVSITQFTDFSPYSILTIRYIMPKWPGFGDNGDVLYRFRDMWYFITVWTIIISLACYIPLGLWAYYALRKEEKYAFVFPIFFILYGMVFSFIAVSIAGKYHLRLYDETR